MSIGEDGCLCCLNGARRVLVILLNHFMRPIFDLKCFSCSVGPGGFASGAQRCGRGVSKHIFV